MLVRAPIAPLRPFVKSIWATESDDLDVRSRSPRERVLPTGTTSVAFLFGAPLRLFRDDADLDGAVVGHAVVGGPREASYLKDVSRPALSVGAQLQPGAVAAVLGVLANEIAGRH